MQHRLNRTLAAAALGALLLGACGSGPGASGGSSGSVAPTKPQRDVLTKLLSLNFEQVAPAQLGAGDVIHSAVANGPSADVALAGPVMEPLRLVTGRNGHGQGVAFPLPCPFSLKPTCPKAIIEVDPDSALDPGTKDYEWGVSLLLAADETSEGSNILQKGFSTGAGSQWKLQVDGEKGYPSCVVVGTDDATIHEVYADVTVADGKWHDVSCRRDGAELAISVDGAERRSTPVPKELAIFPEGPVRIGGKGLRPNNDQYFGTLDDVFVAGEP